MSDPYEVVKAKIGTLRSEAEIEGFLEQLAIQGDDTPTNRNLIEMRRAELRGLNRPMGRK